MRTLAFTIQTLHASDDFVIDRIVYAGKGNEAHLLDASGLDISL